MQVLDYDSFSIIVGRISIYDLVALSMCSKEMYRYIRNYSIERDGRPEVSELLRRNYRASVAFELNTLRIEYCGDLRLPLTKVFEEQVMKSGYSVLSKYDEPLRVTLTEMICFPEFLQTLSNLRRSFPELSRQQIGEVLYTAFIRCINKYLLPKAPIHKRLSQYFEALEKDDFS